MDNDSDIWAKLTEEDRTRAYSMLEGLKPEDVRFCLYHFYSYNGKLYGLIRCCVFDRTDYLFPLFDLCKK